MSVRAVLDTSTLVGAALRNGSVPHQAFLAAIATCDICASMETLAELENVLGRDKFEAYLDREARHEFVSTFRRNARIFIVQEADLRAMGRACRDSSDNKFLALALAADADVLVSSDDDLLVLHPWSGINIVTPRQFLDRSGALSHPNVDRPA